MQISKKVPTDGYRADYGETQHDRPDGRYANAIAPFSRLIRAGKKATLIKIVPRQKNVR